MSNPTITPELAAEQVTIGALLLVSDDLRRSALNTLQGDDFTDLRCRFVANVARTMVSESVPVDAITVHAYVERHGLLADGQLRGSLALWIADRCSEVPVPAALPWYVLTIVEQSTRRKVVEAAERINNAATGAVADFLITITAETAALNALSDRMRAVGSHA